MTEGLLTIPQVRELVPLSRDALYRAIRSGELPAYKPGGRVMVKPSDLETWVESTRVRAERRELPTRPLRLVKGRRGNLGGAS